MPPIYRFRTAEQVLSKFHELETQTIYFAKPAELNDPMESDREMVWNHNRLDLWHLVFDRFMAWFDLQERKGHKPTPFDLPITYFQDPGLRHLERLKLFDTLIQPLAETSLYITRHQMRFFLSYVYKKLLTTLTIETDKVPDVDWSVYLDHMEALIQEGNSSRIEEILSSHDRKVTEYALSQERALHEQGYSDEIVELSYIPDKFLGWIERYIFPKFYVACFSAQYSDTTMWSHYANGHTGVCLIFEASPRNGELFLEDNGAEKYSKFHLRKVNYCSETPTINVLKALGNLEDFRRTIPSPRATRLWPENHLEFIRDIIITKTLQWERECEYRLIWEFLQEDQGMPSVGISHRERKVRYDFNKLTGVIFGSKTTNQDKIAIVNILDKKCQAQGRSDFNYYQSYLENGKVKRFKIQIS